MSEFILEARNLSKSFGSFVANRDVTLKIQPGERRALIGPNGAGKTTLFNMLGGQLKPSSGRVFLNGINITAMSATKRSRLGIARTFQITNLFAGMSVLDNVQVTLAAKSRARWVFWKDLSSTSNFHNAALRHLDMWNLSDVANEDVAELSYGKQRLLEIVLSLCGNPKLLLLDEPTAGLAEADVIAVTKLIKKLPRAVTTLIIEHDMDVAFTVADEVTVLRDGEVIFEGVPQFVMKNEDVRAAYLGGYTGA